MLVQYMKLAYPRVPFRTDGGGIRLTPGLARKFSSLQYKRAFPDFFICYPNYGYHGCFIELKRPGTKLYTKQGKMVADTHIREQAAMLKELWDLGYQARFAVGFERAKQVVDEYLIHVP
jgi:hypothetical protein